MAAPSDARLMRESDFFATAAARIGEATQLLESLFVARFAFALPEDVTIGLHAKIMQARDDVFGATRHGACLIDVFDPYQPLTMICPRIQIAGQCGDQRTGVKRAGRRGGESSDVRQRFS